MTNEYDKQDLNDLLFFCISFNNGASFYGLSLKCLYAFSDAFLPLDVLRTIPIFNKNGSTTSTSVSVSSCKVAAIASIPTGPPL